MICPHTAKTRLRRIKDETIHALNVESKMAGNKKKRVIRLLLLALVEDDEDEVQADRRFWVRLFIAKRFAMGAYQNLVKELQVCSLIFASCFASRCNTSIL